MLDSWYQVDSSVLIHSNSSVHEKHLPHQRHLIFPARHWFLNLTSLGEMSNQQKLYPDCPYKSFKIGRRLQAINSWNQTKYIMLWQSQVLPSISETSIIKSRLSTSPPHPRSEKLLITLTKGANSHLMLSFNKST